MKVMGNTVAGWASMVCLVSVSREGFSYFRLVVIGDILGKYIWKQIGLSLGFIFRLILHDDVQDFIVLLDNPVTF